MQIKPTPNDDFLRSIFKSKSIVLVSSVDDKKTHNHIKRFTIKTTSISLEISREILNQRTQKINTTDYHAWQTLTDWFAVFECVRYTVGALFRCVFDSFAKAIALQKKQKRWNK